ncbi:Carboxylesterase NlhH [Symmachiella macrocystis]|uniref:Carboxylesterase NlhH n=1 Tax=Symmachiella macrocystis TaxID=2527985 RepID=A0A5C6BNS0_9PLAN|nr:alpha/beta hydrolase [Symmachiella macrocystis]TWU13397.1 Carboxylesterase NlhH [Symmachiella macrocystis]
MSQFNRREFVQRGLAGTATLAWAVATDAQETSVSTKTYTYKKVGDLEIKADVHRIDDNVKRPVVVWIHGGALIVGNRAGIDKHVKARMIDAGYAIVSIDYRLAPETQLPAIIEDLEDAFRWVRDQGPKLFHVDATKIAVMGGSAGGYLTLMSGYRVKPRPSVLVAFFGYGDLVGDWYSSPSKHARHQQIKLTKAEAYKQVSGPPIADTRNRKGDGGAFYQYCRQHGLWPLAVSGWDPHSETEKFNPYMPLQNVTRDFPPTMLIHGTKDTDVPYEQSVLMAEQLKQHGVEYQLVTIPGGEHGLGGGDPKIIDAAYKSAGAFVDRYLQPSSL